mgnify:CR=1 FL=1
MRELEIFLQDIEKRAFRMAQLATHSEADALDIVQDAMIKLASKYSERQPSEWRPLFFKILENRILDWHRKQTVMKKIFFWRKDGNDTDDHSELTLEQADFQFDPESQLASEQLGTRLLSVIELLPMKQQQCFLLRSWEGLSTKETAEVMNINENSVKTHYARALSKLKQQQADIERT